VTTLRIYGQAALETVETTLTIPEGTPLSGTLTAHAPVAAYWSDDYYAGEVPAAAAAAEPRTVADIGRRDRRDARQQRPAGHLRARGQ